MTYTDDTYSYKRLNFADTDSYPPSKMLWPKPAESAIHTHKGTATDFIEAS